MLQNQLGLCLDKIYCVRAVNVAGSAWSVSNNLYWLFAEVVAILEPGDRSVAADLLPSVPSAGIDSTVWTINCNVSELILGWFCCNIAIGSPSAYVVPFLSGDSSKIVVRTLLRM